MICVSTVQQGRDKEDIYLKSVFTYRLNELGQIGRGGAVKKFCNVFFGWCGAYGTEGVAKVSRRDAA